MNTMAKYNITPDNLKMHKDLQAQMALLGTSDKVLDNAIAEFENGIADKQGERLFAEFVVKEVSKRVGNNQAWSGEPLYLINAHKGNTSFGGEVLEVLGGYNMQGIEYVAVNKYKKWGEYYASAVFLPDDFYIKNGELWVNDIYKDTGAIPHHYKKFTGRLVDDTEVSDLRTYVAEKKWQDIEEKRQAKNEKIAESKANK